MANEKSLSRLKMTLTHEMLVSFQQHSYNIAILDGNRSVTYQWLYEKSLYIAKYIQAQGLQKSCIAISVADPVDHVVTLAGIVLSGNYYLSVTEENARMLEQQHDLAISLCISDEQATRPFVSVKLSHILNQHSLESLALKKQTGDCEWVCAFLTSGSTGKSKIILHNHRTIATQTLYEIKENNITAADNIDLVFSMSFSATLSCIFPALLSGATLCMYNLKEQGIHGLANFWQQQAVSFTTLSVSTFHAICKIVENMKHLQRMRFVSISAEPLKNTTVALFYEKFPPNTELQIAYASTETRTIADIKITNGSKRSIPVGFIGKVCKGKQVYIMDDDGNLVNDNFIGEMVVESELIADSYHGQPSASASAFKKTGSLIQYKTGDLGYFDNVGNLFYAGRKQQEIKLNGIKINIAEIETAVEKLEGVQQAATVIQRSATGEYLIAFIKGDEYLATESNMKVQLAAVLPATHLPHFIIELVEFPLTHTGKTDRKQLEKYDVQGWLARQDLNKKYHSIAATDEQVIIAAFKQVLNFSEVNGESNFFNLGGDSLKSLVCVAIIEKKLKRSISAVQLIAHPTPAKLNAFLASTTSGKPPLVHTVNLNAKKAGKRNLYIIHSQTNAGYNPLYKTKLAEKFNLVGIYFDLENEVSARVNVEMLLKELETIIGNDKGALVMGSSFNGYIAHQLACLLPQVSYCILVDTYNYFQYEKRKIKPLEFVKTVAMHAVKYGDYILPIDLVKSGCRNIVRSFIKRKAPVKHDAINNFVDTIHYRSAINNCIYFGATRSEMFLKSHGSDWQQYISGDFHFRSLVGDHSQLITKHNRAIAEFIVAVVK